MRKVVTGAFISMDGVMQAPGTPEEDPTGGFRFGGWVFPYADEAFGAEVGRLFGEGFDLLLGRRTYDIFAAHWPYINDDDNPIARAFNSTTKYVATRSEEKLSWKGSVALPDAARDVAALKRTDGPALVTQGSTDMLQTLLKNDLIDELMLFIFPILLGSGKKLFGAGTSPAAFELTRCTTSPAGVIMATYCRNGDVRTGSFAIDPPTPGEIERRAKLARDG